MYNTLSNYWLCLKHAAYSTLSGIYLILWFNTITKRQVQGKHPVVLTFAVYLLVCVMPHSDINDRCIYLYFKNYERALSLVLIILLSSTDHKTWENLIISV